MNYLRNAQLLSFGWSIAILSTSSAVAQQVSGTMPTAAVCDSAVQAIAAGLRSGWEVLPSCPAGGLAVASALRAARLETDSMFLARLFNAASRVRSPDIHNAAVALLADQSAAPQARVVGALVGLVQFEGNYTASTRRSWNSILTEPSGTACPVVARNLDKPYAIESVMPSDYLARFGVALENAYRSSISPLVVRDVSRCVRNLITDSLPLRVSDTEINLTYMCGNRFRVRNSGQEWAMVRWDVYQTTDTGVLEVGPNEDVLFTTEFRGTTRLFYGDRLIRTKANGNSACPQ